MKAPRFTEPLIPYLVADVDQTWAGLVVRVGEWSLDEFQTKMDEIEEAKEKAKTLGDESLVGMVAGASELILRLRCEAQASRKDR